MSRRFKIVLSPDREEGGFNVTVPALPGCVTQGETIEESISRAKEAIEGFIEALQLVGQPIPDSDVFMAEVEVNCAETA
ncbi:MAG: type II toxin-antitoxin system HicB family antitoxin [Sporomusaceae bacterium]|jgi:predicted RNase H-like HicB family nuclease|nr:type II toxin-antitoxin system HicB family antitoxin [Sporomusaceae bacterium]